MASFLRRLVAKSRSSSPQKGTTGAGGNHAGASLPPAYPPPLGNIEDDDWAPGPPPCSSAFANHVPNASSANRHGNHSQGHFGHHSHAEQYRLPDQMPMNSLAKANHVGHQHSHQPLPPPSPTSNRRSPPGGRPLTSKAQSPASFRRQQPQQFSLDEPGTSSQEILSSPSLWSPSSPLPAHHWALRNSHSNPPTTGSSSQRPSSTQAGLTRLDELSSAQTLLDPEKRPRSSSPRKPAGDKRGTTGTPLLDRSRSPPKKGASGKKAAAPATAKTLDYLQAQCRLEGCSASILVEDSRFLVCKHQLSHSSDFFRTLFLNSYALPMEGVRHVGEDEYVVQVSSLRHPPQALQFQWFLETTVPSPLLRDISDDLLETCMRLCKRFAARGLEMRCTKFIKDNVEAKPPLMALCWLNWSFKHHFHRSVQDTCLPVVARLSLCQLEKHRQMLPEAVFADLLAMKLRTAYQQTSTVFHSIHRLDHFHVEMPQCPRCGRQREQGRVRVQASPCHKLIGCERCMRDFQCELGNEQAAQQMQAFWQCEHGLWPFSERTEDCRCQTSLYKANWASGGGQSTVEETSSSSRQQQQQQRPPTAAAGASGGRFASNLTLASKPSHSSRS